MLQQAIALLGARRAAQQKRAPVVQLMAELREGGAAARGPTRRALESELGLEGVVEAVASHLRTMAGAVPSVGAQGVGGDSDDAGLGPALRALVDAEQLAD